MDGEEILLRGHGGWPDGHYQARGHTYQPYSSKYMMISCHVQYSLLQIRCQFWGSKVILTPILDELGGNPDQRSWRVAGWLLPSTETRLWTVFIEKTEDLMSYVTFNATHQMSILRVKSYSNSNSGWIRTKSCTGVMEGDHIIILKHGGTSFTIFIKIIEDFMSCTTFNHTPNQ